MSLMEKFSAVEIKADNRISEDSVKCVLPEVEIFRLCVSSHNE